MFLQNKYTIRYEIIIARAQARTFTDGYTENHHIIPRNYTSFFLRLRSTHVLDHFELSLHEHFVR